MAVIGEILGDIASSRFEFIRQENLDWKHCELFTEESMFTDDTIMTLAIRKSILNEEDIAETMREVGQPYPYYGYGAIFISGCMRMIQNPTIV